MLLIEAWKIALQRRVSTNPKFALRVILEKQVVTKRELRNEFIASHITELQDFYLETPRSRESKGAEVLWLKWRAGQASIQCGQ